MRTPPGARSGAARSAGQGDGSPGPRPTSSPPPPRPLDVDRVLDTATVVVCCGSGGVGKTTTAAALALRAAERGRRTVVLTIDPARRLAQSMGLSELDNVPRPVAGVDTSRGGSLDAMMLDMKRTFDEIVLSHAEPARARQILDNPFYQALSSSFAGTQEYMAMEKLSQLVTAGGHELVVVDTPPTRSALDFLEAPERMTTLMDGRMVRILLAPAKAGGRAYLKVVTTGISVFTSAITRIIGAQVLQDVSQFVAAFETMFGGFRERAEQTYDLLKQPGTSFVVVAAPERDALREASYFVERLAREQMPLAGLVVNRVHRSAAQSLSAERALAAAEDLQRRVGDGVEDDDEVLARGVLRLHADRMALDARERRLQERFTHAHPGVPVARVAALAGDVHDLDGLRAIGAMLTEQVGPPSSGTGRRAAE